MKSLFILTLVIISVLFSDLCRAQKAVIRPLPCNDTFIAHQADSLNALFSKDGFQLMKRDFVTMESAFELPIIVPLTTGSWYQFAFIGDYSSKLYEVRMYDWNEKMVVYKKKYWGDVDGNIITYSYIPRFNEYHMIKPVQVNKKKKELCGCVLLWKKVEA